MRGDIKQPVDTNSTDFKHGVEAGLNSAEDSKDWQAGNELGQELKEVEKEVPIGEPPLGKASVPLFMRDGPECNKANAQDEKDESEE